MKTGNNICSNIKINNAKNTRWWNNLKIIKYKGFTLIELIVIIVILAILGTIGFTNISNYSSSARDGDRISTLKNIDSGLTIFQIKSGSYPMPDSNGSLPVLTWSIGGVVYSYLGIIGNGVSRVINISNNPIDPLSKVGYVYGVSREQKYYQTATILENTEIFNTFLPSFVSKVSTLHRQQEWHRNIIRWLDWELTPTTYADSSIYKAKVNGVYPGYFKFNSGSEAWIANIPSLIWNNTGSVNLLNTGTYFVAHRQSNLPHPFNGYSRESNKDADQIIQSITGTWVSRLVGVNISNATSEWISSIFTGSLLASFGGDIKNIRNIALAENIDKKGAQNNTQATACTPPSTDIHEWNTYSILNNTPINHWNSRTINGTYYFGANPSNGSLSASFNYTCNNWMLIKNSSTRYSWSCSSGYVFNNNYSTPACTPVVQWICNNSSRGSCSSWTRNWINNTTSCWTTATWNCLWSGWGSNSPTCSYYNWTCAPTINCNLSWAMINCSCSSATEWSNTYSRISLVWTTWKWSYTSAGTTYTKTTTCMN